MTCQECNYWEDTKEVFHTCEHPDVGGDMIFHKCWGDPELYVDAKFGCILFKLKEKQ